MAESRDLKDNQDSSTDQANQEHVNDKVPLSDPSSSSSAVRKGTTEPCRPRPWPLSALPDELPTHLRNLLVALLDVGLIDAQSVDPDWYPGLENFYALKSIVQISTHFDRITPGVNGVTLSAIAVRHRPGVGQRYVSIIFLDCMMSNITQEEAVILLLSVGPDSEDSDPAWSGQRYITICALPRFHGRI